MQLYQPRTKLEQFEDIIMESKLLNGFNGSSAAALGGKSETKPHLTCDKCDSSSPMFCSAGSFLEDPNVADDVELEELRMLRQLAMATAADTERTAAALSSGPSWIN